MFNFLKKDPVKKLKTEHDKLSTQAFHAQRNGDIKLYSELSFKAQEIQKQIDQIEAESEK
jgi:hypothetical protein